MPEKQTTIISLELSYFYESKSIVLISNRTLKPRSSEVKYMEYFSLAGMNMAKVNQKIYVEPLLCNHPCHSCYRICSKNIGTVPGLKSLQSSWEIRLKYKTIR